MGLWGRSPHRGSRGRAPGVGPGGETPEAVEVFVFKTIIFNASATVLQDMMYCLSCFFCAQVYGFSQNLLSSHCRTASEHHPTNAWVVLRVDGSAQGKNGQKVRGHSPYVDPAPEKVWGGGSIDPWTPWLRGP